MADHARSFAPRELIDKMARVGAREVKSGYLLTALVAFLCIDNLLLWRFLNFAPWWLYLLGIGLAVAACAAFSKIVGRWAAGGPTVCCLAVCAGVALILYLLGGQGRLFYANVDWQVRDAVLRDMTIHSWPFAYTARAVPEILRAPIGMYLVPALAGKSFGPAAADVALLAQNALLLTILLGLASSLFRSTRIRLVALAVFLAFSGMDVIGQFLMGETGGGPDSDHLEQWASIQFSSHITQAFWVPQHALAGWYGAVLYLLWSQRRIPVVALFVLLPLMALWSPLGLLGALPFALYAGLRTIAERGICFADAAVAVLTTGLTLPALLYLAAAGSSVGFRIFQITPNSYLLFQALEALPFLLPVALLGGRNRFGGMTLVLVGACLMIMPFWQIGENVDFMMRSSIPALAILSVQVIEALCTDEYKNRGLRFFAKGVLVATLLVGSVTGALEIRRSIINLPSPRPKCSFFGAWDQSYSAFGKSTYLAPIWSIPSPIRPPHVTIVPAADPRRCYDRPWKAPRALA